jgi:hypothetical protein
MVCVVMYSPASIPGVIVNSTTDLTWTYRGLNQTGSKQASYCNGQSNCMSYFCQGDKGPPVNTQALWLIDSQREQRMSLGREWPFPPLQPYQIIVSSALATQLGIALATQP